MSLAIPHERTFCAVILNALRVLLRNWKDLDIQPSTSPVRGQLAFSTLPDSAKVGTGIKSTRSHPEREKACRIKNSQAHDVDQLSKKTTKSIWFVCLR